MANITSLNYNTKRMYLHADTVANGFNAISAYFEIKLLASINGGNEQFRKSPMTLADKFEKGFDKNNNKTFTSVYAIIADGWRFIAYSGVPHKLYLDVEIVSVERIKDSDVFDFTGLTANVHIIPDYSPQEIIEVNVGGGDIVDSGLTAEEHNHLMAIPDASENADAVWNYTKNDINVTYNDELVTHLGE